MRDYQIKLIKKNDAKTMLESFHYLSKQGFGFRSGFNYGLFIGDKLIGVAIFHNTTGKSTTMSCLGLNTNEQEGIYELGRLVLDPNEYEKNLTSWFVGKSIKQLRKDTNVRAILSYADSAFHNGYIYQATNFKYYGLTPKKRDFWFLLDDGSYKKCQRGKIKGAEGEYRDRSRKHRYLIIFDKTLKCKWEEQPYPKGDNKGEYNKLFL
jgi:hypothetical protein